MCQLILYIAVSLILQLQLLQIGSKLLVPLLLILQHFFLELVQGGMAGIIKRLIFLVCLLLVIVISIYRLLL